MLKQLRFDLYKIVKSKTIKIFLIVSAIACFVNPLVPVLEGGLLAGKWTMKTPFFNAIEGRDPFLIYELVLLFPLVFGLKDYSSGYIKNIYTNVNKFYYVLSKVICILLYAIILRIAYFLASFLVHCCFFNGKIKDLLYVEEQYHSINFTYFFLEQLLISLASAVSGCFVLVVTLLFRKEFISAIITLPYGLYLCNLLTYPLIALTYKIVKKMAIAEKLICFSPFRLADLIQFNVNANNAFMNWMYVVAIVGYIGLSLLLSWLLVRKKNV